MTDFTGKGRSKRWYADARLIILVIFFAGLFLRFVNLDKIAFNTAEAQNAYAAFAAANGLSTGTAASPVYEGLTAPTFFLMGAAPFLARFWPALAGASLVLAPLFWRRRMGSLQAILLAAAFAFDPVLFTLSRQAGGAIFTAVGLIWALSFFFERKPIGLGIALAVAWLSGSWFWIVLVACGIGMGIYVLAQRKVSANGLANTCPFRTKAFRVSAVVSFIVSLLLLASAFLLNPEGLSGIASGLAGLWSSSQAMTNIGFIPQIYRLIAYSLPTILLAFPAVLSAWKEKDKQVQFVSILAGTMLVSVLLFRNQGLAGYALLQGLIWFLAARTLEKQVLLKVERKDITLGAFLLGTAICGYLAVSARNLLNPAQSALTIAPSAIAFVLGLLLLVLIFFLVMMGWSLQTARKGILSAVLLSVLAFSLSLTFLSLNPTNSYPALVWSDSSLWVNADAQNTLLTEIKKTGKLEPQVSSVVITDPQLGSMRWDFRDYRYVVVSSALPEKSPPEIILSTTADQKNAAESYRGIRIVNPGIVQWDTIAPLNLIRAAVSKHLPAESFEYYLWIRQDLMTGALP